MLREHQIANDLDQGLFPSLTIGRFSQRLLNFCGDFGESGASSYINFHLAKELQKKTEGWLRDLNSLKQDLAACSSRTKDFFADIFNVYTALNWQTVLADIPKAKENHLVLMEYDTHGLGVPQHALGQVSELWNRLLIDPDLRAPQEGFPYSIEAMQLYSLMQLRQARLITVSRDIDLQGCCLGSFNHQNTVEWLGGAANQLRDKGRITDMDHIGRIDIIASAKTDRLRLARDGINLYSILTPFMDQAAQQEGVNVLLGVVRLGDNPNTAIKAHRRQGWFDTDVTISLGATNVPYRILLRRLAEYPVIPGLRCIGVASYFETRLNDPALFSPEFERAQMISDDNAVALCNTQFGKIRGTSIEPSIGERLYIMIKRRGLLIQLHQVVPNLDYWRLLGTKSSCGSLNELFPVINNRLMGR